MFSASIVVQFLIFSYDLSPVVSVFFFLSDQTGSVQSCGLDFLLLGDLRLCPMDLGVIRIVSQESWMLNVFCTVMLFSFVLHLMRKQQATEEMCT